jgi:hypothetical protein
MRTARRGLTVLVLLTFAAACATDPYTGEKKVSKTAIGAVIGSAAGAGIGALADKNNRARGALVGTGACAPAGGAIGG